MTDPCSENLHKKGGGEEVTLRSLAHFSFYHIFAHIPAMV